MDALVPNLSRVEPSWVVLMEKPHVWYPAPDPPLQLARITWTCSRSHWECWRPSQSFELFIIAHVMLFLWWRKMQPSHHPAGCIVLPDWPVAIKGRLNVVELCKCIKHLCVMSSIFQPEKGDLLRWRKLTMNCTSSSFFWSPCVWDKQLCYISFQQHSRNSKVLMKATKVLMLLNMPAMISIIYNTLFQQVPPSLMEW